jgi:hypothetical protein
MITCTECVKELTTARLSDIRAGSPVALHYTSCENCKRLVHDLYQSERTLAAALDTFGATTSAAFVSDYVVDTTYRRRRRIARGVRVLLGLVGLMVLGIAIAIRTDNVSSLRGEHVELTCLSGEEASRIAQRFIVTGEHNIILRENGRTIYLEGYGPEVVEAMSQIAVLDGNACALPPTEGTPVNPQDDKSGTD